MRSAPRSYKEKRLRRYDAIVELIVDEISAQTAVIRGPDCGKLKNLHS
jgi:hypothetical protein